MSNNTLALTLSLLRAALHRGTKSIDTVVTMEDVVVQCLEAVAPLNTTGTQIVFPANASPATGLIVYTPQPVTLHLNTSNSVAIPCGSVAVFLDTSLTGLFVDNASMSENVPLEVWLVSPAPT